MKRLIAAALAALVAFATLSTPSRAQDGVRIGFLECTVDAGVGLILGSRRDAVCTFYDADRTRAIEVYDGRITRLGLDVGITAASVILWAVFAPSFDSWTAGSLAGTYVGVSADAALGVGGGGNILVGGNRDAFTLQPFSLQAQAGLNVAVGVARLRLTPL
ncbi:MAG: DUF992 domain-containing protein [Bauldia sp.]|nr:DUF992 domain-containing protein [Bauldia sp.]